MKKEIPILFSTPMVRALLEGRKTQTRRINFKCELGDVLWVRETWAYASDTCEFCLEKYIYKADVDPDIKDFPKIWKPSIFMPKEICRLFLRIKNVRRERLQDISTEDCIAEGIKYNGMHEPFSIEIGSFNHKFHNAQELYKLLWNSLNAKRGYSWESNPMVTVIEFERIENYGGQK